MSKLTNGVFSFTCGVFYFCFGNDPLSLKWLYALIALIVIDFILGVLSAAVNNTFSRREFLLGIQRKVGEVAVVAVAHIIDVTNLMQGSVVLQRAVTISVIAYEAGSILGKIKISGTPVPAVLSDAVKKFIKLPTGTKGINK